MAVSHGHRVANGASPKAQFVAVLCNHLHQQTNEQKKKRTIFCLTYFLISHHAAQLENQGTEKQVKFGQMPMADSRERHFGVPRYRICDQHSIQTFEEFEGTDCTSTNKLHNTLKMPIWSTCHPFIIL